MPELWDGDLPEEEDLTTEQDQDLDWVWLDRSRRLSHLLFMGVGIFLFILGFVLATKATLETFSVNGWSIIWSILAMIGFIIGYIAHLTRP